MVKGTIQYFRSQCQYSRLAAPCADLEVPSPHPKTPHMPQPPLQCPTSMHAPCGDWDVHKQNYQTMDGPQIITERRRRFALTWLALLVVAMMAAFLCIRTERVGPQLLTAQQQGSQVPELGEGAFPRRRGLNKVATCSEP